MSKLDDITQRTLARYPDMTDEGIKQARRSWNPAHHLYRMIELEAERIIDKTRNELETVSELNLKASQGKIEAVREFLGAIKALGQ